MTVQQCEAQLKKAPAHSEFWRLNSHLHYPMHWKGMHNKPTNYK